MKKGNIVMDGIVFIIVIVVFGIIAMIGYQAFTDLKGDVKADLNLSEADNAIDEVDTRYPSVFDGLMALIFAGMWIAGIVAAVMSDQHPLVFGFMMIVIIFVILAGAMLGNFYEEMFKDDDFNTMPSQFPISNWILTHMLQIGIIVIITIMLATLAKNRL